MSEPENSFSRRKKFAIALFVCGILLAIAVVAIPNLLINSEPYSTTPDRKCVNNLRLIDGVKRTWALEHDKSDDAVPTWADILPYLGHTNDNWVMKCPSGGTYTLGAVSNHPICSIPGHALP